MDAPETPWKDAVFSQYPRGKVMGYAMKTDRYRFIEWKDGGTDEVVATELYDHHTDPAENRNLATSPENASLVVTLHERMAAGWQ